METTTQSRNIDEWYCKKWCQQKEVARVDNFTPKDARGRKHCKVDRKVVSAGRRVLTKDAERGARNGRERRESLKGAQPKRSLTRYMSFFLPL